MVALLALVTMPLSRIRRAVSATVPLGCVPAPQVPFVPSGPPTSAAWCAAARTACEGHALQRSAGATAPHDEVVVLRALAPRVEPLMGLFKEVRNRWRRVAWGLDAVQPRIWTT